MLHGTQTYFLERARSARRTSLTTLLVALALLGAQGLLSLPPVRHRLARIDPQRFGFEGPDRYVRRILLESIGPLRLATGRTESTPIQYFPGTLDEIGFYTSALSAVQASAHYTTGTAG